jgi:hypothetical protein
MSGNRKIEGGEKAICRAYFELGWMGEDLFHADRQYGLELYQREPEIWHGYVRWARPVADFISGDDWKNIMARHGLWPFVRSWAREMAHRLEPNKYPPSLLGATICALGLPLCRSIGARQTGRITLLCERVPS